MPKEILPLALSTTTSRGFELIEFQDCYGAKCSLQESSLVEYVKPGTSAVWLGVSDNRMHLKRDQVASLIKHLRTWLSKDTFDFTNV